MSHIKVCYLYTHAIIRTCDEGESCHHSWESNGWDSINFSPFVVVAGDGPSLLGRDWLAKLKLEWKHIFNVHAQETLQDVLE